MGVVDRRAFCRNGMGWIAGAAVLGGMKLSAQQPQTAASQPEEISPAEDLMREHGVLNRILLIYDEASRRLRAAQDFDPAVLVSSAGIIRSFIEDYHEKLEEEYLFPRFEKAGKLTDLVHVLRGQHRAGRRLTDRVQQLSTGKELKEPAGRNELAETLHSFVRMYRPHEAREDTVLFPALRSIISSNEYDSLGEEFEDKEHQLFGEGGFEKTVDKVAQLERALGIYDLAGFTPAS